MTCKNCGETIKLNGATNKWLHWDGYSVCFSNTEDVTMAEPKENNGN